MTAVKTATSNIEWEPYVEGVELGRVKAASRLWMRSHGEIELAGKWVAKLASNKLLGTDGDLKSWFDSEIYFDTREDAELAVVKWSLLTQK